MVDDDDMPLVEIEPVYVQGKITIEQKALYLKVLAETASHQKASEAAHPSVKPKTAADTFRKVIKNDGPFAEQVREALVRAQAALEAMLYDHALNGVDKPVFGKSGGEGSKTEIVGYITEYDHKLAVTLVKRNARILGDKSWEETKTVNHEGSQTVNHTVDFINLPKPERDRIIAERARLRAKGVIDAESKEQP